VKYEGKVINCSPPALMALMNSGWVLAISIQNIRIHYSFFSGYLSGININKNSKGGDHKSFLEALSKKPRILKTNHQRGEGNVK